MRWGSSRLYLIIFREGRKDLSWLILRECYRVREGKPGVIRFLIKSPRLVCNSTHFEFNKWNEPDAKMDKGQVLNYRTSSSNHRNQPTRHNSHRENPATYHGWPLEPASWSGFCLDLQSSLLISAVHGISEFMLALWLCDIGLSFSLEFSLIYLPEQDFYPGEFVQSNMEIVRSYRYNCLMDGVLIRSVFDC